MTCGFLPKLDAYLHEDEMFRPCMILVPGGAYRCCYPTEGEPVALSFYKMGYQIFVCTYTTNPLGQVPLRLQPAFDLARAVRTVRKNAEAYRVIPERIVTCGFSAGGHVVGTLGVHFEDFADMAERYKRISCRPDAMILAYPVISVFSEIAHQESSERLLGKNPSEEEKEYMCLEKHVTEKCPPVFLWQTITDEIVPVQNSIAFANGCYKKKVRFAFHLFSEGIHGLSLADDTVRCTTGNSYTLEQTKCIFSAVEHREIELDQKITEQFESLPEVRAGKEGIEKLFTPGAHPEVQSWRELADNWLHGVWSESR